MKISTHKNPAVRLVAGGILGGIAVVGMFAMLHRLVDVPFDTPPLYKSPLPEFTQVKVTPPPIKPPPPVKPVRELPTDVQSITTLVTAGPSGVDRPGPYIGPTFNPVDFPTGIEGNGIQPVGNDQDVMPQLRISPLYPVRAETRGIEGWVRVRFTITPTGAVRDARVVAAEPDGEFEEAALRAIERWRYNPRIVDGVPVERVGMETLIEFQLTE